MINTYQPKGGMCRKCTKRNNDCSNLDFASMKTIQIDFHAEKTVNIVKCSQFERKIIVKFEVDVKNDETRIDAERLRSVARGMSYNDPAETVHKHVISEIAMRLETGFYYSESK